MENVVTKKDIEKCRWRWMLWSHSGYNYERMQAMAVCWAHQAIIKKLYPAGDERRKEALLRQLIFFNTEVFLGSAIIGLSAAMEEQYAKGELEDPDLITSIKSGLMGPFAGIGDTLTQVIITPIVVSIAISLVLGGNTALGPILVIVVGCAWVIFEGYVFFNLGHDKGSEALLDLLENGMINQLIDAAGILGCTVMGGLVASYVKLQTVLVISTDYSSFNLQTDVLDAILPNMLPLALTFAIYALYKKGWRVGRITLLIFAVGIVGSLIGIF
jgi:mannose PTS system EIID component